MLTLTVALVHATSPAEQIANLTCYDTLSTATHYRNAESQYMPVITNDPTAPLTIALSSTEANADAFWLHNDDGDLIASSFGSSSATFDISAFQPKVVTAFVHYSSP